MILMCSKSIPPGQQLFAFNVFVSSPRWQCGTNKVFFVSSRINLYTKLNEHIFYFSLFLPKSQLCNGPQITGQVCNGPQAKYRCRDMILMCSKSIPPGQQLFAFNVFVSSPRWQCGTNKVFFVSSRINLYTKLNEHLFTVTQRFVMMKTLKPVYNSINKLLYCALLCFSVRHYPIQSMATNEVLVDKMLTLSNLVQLKDYYKP